MRDDISVFIPHVMESIFIELKTGSNETVVIGVIYRPNTPPRADIDIFNKHLSDIMDQVTNENKKIILAGDFNIDLLKYDSHNKTNDFVDDIFAHGMLPLITKPTRITNHSATIIDHIHTNIQDKYHKCGIIITDVSDHLGIFSIFNRTPNLKGSQIIQTRNFSENNITVFRRILKDANYCGILNCTDANESYNSFLELYQTSFDIAFPPKRINIKIKMHKREPWMTLGLVKSSETKQKLYLKKIKNY